MNYLEVEAIADTWVMGNYDHALNRLQRGCKTKPLEFAARCLRVKSELLGMGQYAQAERLVSYIEKKAGE